jgi:hypothetical protein
MTMVLAVTLVFVAIVGLLSIVGFGPVALMAPDLEGRELLLCPAVGLAVMYLACQLLSSIAPSSEIVIGTCVAGAALSAVTVVYKRGRWRQRAAGLRPGLLVTLPLGLLTSIALQLPMLRGGTFTLANYGLDDLFTWAPVADYMRDHAYAAGRPLAYTSPLLWLLPANAYPGSAGTVDGGFGAILRLDAYQFVEPLTAVCLGLAVGGVYLLVTVGLRFPRWVAILAAVLAATNEYIFNTAGSGFAQSARGAVLMLAALTLLTAAVRERSTGAAILAGGVTAVLSAVYMPVFIVVLASIVGGMMAVVATAIAHRRLASPWRPLAALVISGLVIGAANVKWLVLDGGLRQWALFSSYKTFGSATHGYLVPSLVGTRPVEGLYRDQGMLFWNGAWNAASIIVSLMTLSLIFAGAVTLGLARRGFDLMCLLAPLAYGIGVILVSNGGFGVWQTAAYLAPILGVLTAIGAAGIATARRRPSQSLVSAGPAGGRRLHIALLSLVVVSVLAFQTAATIETEAFFVRQPGILPPATLAIRDMASVVPDGASVLIYSLNGSDNASTFIKSNVLTAAALFLPGREITLEGRPWDGRAAKADSAAVAAAIALHYDYILRFYDPSIDDPPVPSTYAAVWSYRTYGLVLYRRAS